MLRRWRSRRPYRGTLTSWRPRATRTKLAIHVYRRAETTGEQRSPLAWSSDTSTNCAATGPRGARAAGVFYLGQIARAGSARPSVLCITSMWRHPQSITLADRHTTADLRAALNGSSARASAAARRLRGDGPHASSQVTLFPSAEAPPSVTPLNLLLHGSDLLRVPVHVPPGDVLVEDRPADEYDGPQRGRDECALDHSVLLSVVIR